MYQRLRPFIFKIDPENAHHTILAACRAMALFPGATQTLEYLINTGHPELSQQLFGSTFKSPIGLAAGFDKNAQMLPALAALGFGFIEVGSVSAQAWPGNPKPRIFRLPEDHALINRMGLNNEGVACIVERLKKLKTKIPIGINITKTPDATICDAAATDDFMTSYAAIENMGCYHALNISCPNTAEGKTFEDPAILDHLLKQINTLKRTRPLLIKLAPDIYQQSDTGRLRELLAICRKHEISGYIVANTTTQRKELKTSQARLDQIGRGGLSGRPLFEHTKKMIAAVYQETMGEVPIIAVGGISSVDDVFTAIAHGASLVQVYTALIYQGPFLVKHLSNQLLQRLRTEKIETIMQLRARAL